MYTTYTKEFAYGYLESKTDNTKFEVDKTTNFNMMINGNDTYDIVYGKDRYFKSVKIKLTDFPYIRVNESWKITYGFSVYQGFNVADCMALGYFDVVNDCIYKQPAKYSFTKVSGATTMTIVVPQLMKNDGNLYSIASGDKLVVVASSDTTALPLQTIVTATVTSGVITIPCSATTSTSGKVTVYFAKSYGGNYYFDSGDTEKLEKTIELGYSIYGFIGRTDMYNDGLPAITGYKSSDYPIFLWVTVDKLYNDDVSLNNIRRNMSISLRYNDSYSGFFTTVALFSNYYSSSVPVTSKNILNMLFQNQEDAATKIRATVAYSASSAYGYPNVFFAGLLPTYSDLSSPSEYQYFRDSGFIIDENKFRTTMPAADGSWINYSQELSTKYGFALSTSTQYNTTTNKYLISGIVIIKQFGAL